MKRSRTVAVLVAGLVAAGGLTACSAGSSSSGGTTTITVMAYQQTRIDIMKKVDHKNILKLH